jgi:anti-sigma factor RsiW
MADPLPTDEPMDAELIAYLDGELDEHSAKEMERRLDQEPGLKATAEGYKRTWELLDYLPQPEPSPTFTTRTVDKMAVLRPAQAPVSQTMSSLTAAAAPTTPTPASGADAWRWVGVVTAAVVLFVLGYGISGISGHKHAPPDDREVEEQMARDLRVLDHWNLYQYGDDLTFVETLARPEYFGDDASGH